MAEEVEIPENTEDSMEDILHSIRDIIADEDGDEPAEASEEEEVLELTDVAEETDDVLSDIDAALEEPAAVEEEAPQAIEPVAPTPAPEVSADALIDEATAAASSSVMQSLVNSVPRPAIERKDFRSGNTVEDLTLEALRPMLKQWLDGNLEPLVREIVEREIKKLLPRE